MRIEAERLRSVLRRSERELSRFREQYRERLELYAGSGYGATGEDLDTPFNAYNLALRIYKRRLFSGRPRVLVRARSPGARLEAYELGLACDRLLERLNFARTMEDAIGQALLAVGIVKVAIDPASGEPYCEPVLLEDFSIDTDARALEEADWIANRYLVPADRLARDEEYFSEAGERERQAVVRGADDEESVLRLGQEPTPTDEALRRYVSIWDVYLPKERLLVTLREEGGGFLRKEPWTGPEHGPFHILGFDNIPGNVMPVAPAGHLESLARLLNRAMRKLGNQLDRQKTLSLITRAAGADGTGQAIQDAADGEAITCDDPRAVNEIRLGGIDRDSYAFFLTLRDLFSWLGGNIDTIGGLSAKAGTLGQERILMQGGNSLVAELESRVLEFTKRIVTDLCWYIYTDPAIRMPLVKQIEGTELELPFMWTSERRRAPWDSFEFQVDPFSVHVRSPSERLQGVVQLLPLSLQFAQLAQVMGQMGAELDMEAAWKLLMRYTGLDEFGELLKFVGEPLTPEPKQPIRPVMAREYIHKSVNLTPERELPVAEPENPQLRQAG